VVQPVVDEDLLLRVQHEATVQPGALVGTAAAARGATCMPLGAPPVPPLEAPPVPPLEAPPVPPLETPPVPPPIPPPELSMPKSSSA
jgi:hypothetical protein